MPLGMLSKCGGRSFGAAYLFHRAHRFESELEGQRPERAQNDEAPPG